MLKYITSLSTLVKSFLSWTNVDFCQVLFLPLLRMIIWLCLFLCCDISQWLICVHWAIPVNLGWMFHGVWSFLCMVGFSLLIFCWEFLHLYSSKILAWNFLFWWESLVLVSGWWWLYRMSLGVFLPLQSFGRVWKGSVKISLCLVEFSCEAIWVLDFYLYGVCFF